jgi:hypothetical protein
MDPEEFWVWHMAEIESDIEDCRQGALPASQLVLQRGRQYQARKQLDAVRAEKARLAAEAERPMPDDAGPEEVIAGMVSALLEMPPDMLRRILDQVGGSGLRVVQGG